ncbi:UDP-galactopyranose mutase [Immundisolibacter cernigliae]|uniref:UDP-galactopyranose mutase n=1 Tax=Immundisolibacter cernigliae TaxID=1810504 RepID=UPI00096AD231|nr:UDP-galactopyranose mutase [Immundisolibacter cernigliae]
MQFDILIVGAGLAGSVCARELADAGHTVLVIDKRSHVGGNAYDRYDDHGVLIHPYGPHIFHTNAKRVLEWLSRFTTWRFYEHRVLASVDGRLFPIPINRTTLNKLYRLDLDESGAAAWLERVRQPRDHIRTSEDLVLSSVGSELCEKFFRGYTRKQWGLDLSDLSAGVAARIPTRTNDDDRYFTDTYQLMPAEGYSAMFRCMLDHPNITTHLETDYFTLRSTIQARHTIYTGPIDAFFNYRFGRLPYRSILFEHRHFPDVPAYQSVGTINYPNEEDYTRVTEFKHLTGQSHTGTSIVREYPQSNGEPYYPIPRPQHEEIFQQYNALADQLLNVTFVGRLAQYRYYNMDQIVAAALKKSEYILTHLK